MARTPGQNIGCAKHRQHPRDRRHWSIRYQLEAQQYGVGVLCSAPRRDFSRDRLPIYLAECRSHSLMKIVEGCEFTSLHLCLSLVQVRVGYSCCIAYKNFMYRFMSLRPLWNLAKRATWHREIKLTFVFIVNEHVFFIIILSYSNANVKFIIYILKEPVAFIAYKQRQLNAHTTITVLRS